MVNCCVHLCRSNSSNGLVPNLKLEAECGAKRNITYHSIPKANAGEEKRISREKYIQVLRKGGKKSDWEPTKNAKVCSLHYPSEVLMSFENMRGHSLPLDCIPDGVKADEKWYSSINPAAKKSRKRKHEDSTQSPVPPQVHDDATEFYQNIRIMNGVSAALVEGSFLVRTEDNRNLFVYVKALDIDESDFQPGIKRKKVVRIEQDHTFEISKEDLNLPFVNVENTGAKNPKEDETTSLIITMHPNRVARDKESLTYAQSHPEVMSVNDTSSQFYRPENSLLSACGTNEKGKEMDDILNLDNVYTGLQSPRLVEEFHQILASLKSSVSVLRSSSCSTPSTQCSKRRQKPRVSVPQSRHLISSSALRGNHTVTNIDLRNINVESLIPLVRTFPASSAGPQSEFFTILPDDDLCHGVLDGSEFDTLQFCGPSIAELDSILDYEAQPTASLLLPSLSGHGTEERLLDDLHNTHIIQTQKPGYAHSTSSEDNIVSKDVWLNRSTNSSPVDPPLDCPVTDEETNCTAIESDWDLVSEYSA